MLHLTYISFKRPSFSSAMVARSRACLRLVVDNSDCMALTTVLVMVASFWSSTNVGCLEIDSSADFSKKRKYLRNVSEVKGRLQALRLYVVFPNL
jgi:hypothetical protein